MNKLYIDGENFLFKVADILRVSKLVKEKSDITNSDMIPVVREVQKRGAEVIYVGFATQPNHGLIATCNRSILFRDDEIIESYKQANK